MSTLTDGWQFSSKKNCCQKVPEGKSNYNLRALKPGSLPRSLKYFQFDQLFRERMVSVVE
jgi:hypothetical protein